MKRARRMAVMVRGSLACLVVAAVTGISSTSAAPVAHGASAIGRAAACPVAGQCGTIATTPVSSPASARDAMANPTRNPERTLTSHMRVEIGLLAWLREDAAAIPAGQTVFALG